jgi:hypothetical protein
VRPAGPLRLAGLPGQGFRADPFDTGFSFQCLLCTGSGDRLTCIAYDLALLLVNQLC